MKTIDLSKLNTTLKLLDEQLTLSNSPAIEIVVCGGSALILALFHARHRILILLH